MCSQTRGCTETTQCLLALAGRALHCVRAALAPRPRGSSIPRDSFILLMASRGISIRSILHHTVSLWRHHTSVCPTPVIVSTRKPIFSSLSSTRRGGSSTWYSELHEHKHKVIPLNADVIHDTNIRIFIPHICWTSLLQERCLPALAHLLLVIEVRGHLLCDLWGQWSTSLVAPQEAA
ncbi:hypothetical protein EYF80_002389 [Liparis tanakae]|uniref:Uncharacterized protein n=1 Tax=Liparis tanakae TaxID=230148 RepID=A0A4Z2JB06_9TELE|nr:hypothetical protein EYF80_002389 [Liparis tanakae]